MAEKAAQNMAIKAEPSAEGETTNSEKKAFWRRLIPRKWVAIVLGVSIVNFAFGFLCCGILQKSDRPGENMEVDLGTFQFEVRASELDTITGAEFVLHIALLDVVDEQARDRLTTHTYRVRQNVEELLRKAHGGDFEDPSLGGLKRQIQEQVNETLGIRAIADVMITNLQLRHRDNASPLLADTARAAP
ncbi:MAG TPA: hypothetical protein VMY42_11895 [Thermoguttaceae bacterium]|nr:hypothetical protein [Thermoguttaceae bacterium]